MSVVFKYCPNCKSSAFTSNDGHRYLCSACQFEYFHNTAAAVAAIIVCKNEILFAVRAKEPAKGMLDLPGGL